MSTQNTQVVLQGVLTKESEEKHAEVHEQVETCVKGVWIFNIFLYILKTVFIVFENYFENSYQIIFL